LAESPHATSGSISEPAIRAVIFARIEVLDNMGMGTLIVERDAQI
jgi:hypothetical protein